MGKSLTEAVVDIADGLDSIARGLRGLLNYLNTESGARLHGEKTTDLACLTCGGPVTTIGFHHCDNCRNDIAPAKIAPTRPKPQPKPEPQPRHEQPTKRKYRPKPCAKCGTKFTPTGPRSAYCAQCG